jgi:hypothetical protein
MKKVYNSIKKGLKQAISLTKKNKKENIVKKELLKIWKSKRTLKYKIKDSQGVLSDARQRYKYGYADYDWYEFYYNFCDRNQKLFEQFRDNGVSCLWRHPRTEHNFKTQDIMTEEEQKEFFNKLISLLEAIKEDDYLSLQFYNKKEYELTFEERQHIEDIRQECVDEFCDILSEHLLQLWD